MVSPSKYKTFHNVAFWLQSGNSAIQHLKPALNRLSLLHKMSI